jgi:hypothetical protein
MTGDLTNVPTNTLEDEMEALMKASENGTFAR